MPIDVQAHAFNAIWTGFVLVDAIVPAYDRVPLDTQVAALTETIRRTFESDVLPPTEVLRDHMAPAFRVFLAQARQAIVQQIQARVRIPE